MKIMWCWRCKKDVAVLDEAEAARVRVFLRDAKRPAAEFQEKYGLPPGELPRGERLRPALEEYRRITGMETDSFGIWHHVMSRFGPPCGACGKPLRTPQARRCMECGAPNPR